MDAFYYLNASILSPVKKNIYTHNKATSGSAGKIFSQRGISNSTGANNKKGENPFKSTRAKLIHIRISSFRPNKIIFHLFVLALEYQISPGLEKRMRFEGANSTRSKSAAFQIHFSAARPAKNSFRSWFYIVLNRSRHTF